MDKLGAIAGVFAVVAGVEVAARDIDGALLDERIELGGLAGELRCDLGGVVGSLHAAIGGDGRPSEGELGIGLHGNLRGSGVIRRVDKAREGKVVARARALVIEAEGVGAREAHRDALVDEEGQGGAEAGHLKLILAGRCEFAEVGHEHLLIRRGRRVVTNVQARRETAVVDRGTCPRIDEGEAGSSRDRHLAHVAEKVADHGLLRQRRHVTFLVDVNRRAVALRVAECLKLRAARPERTVGIRHLHQLAVGDRRRELEIKAVFNTQVVLLERSVEDAALEADGLHRHRLATHGHGELRGGGRGHLPAAAHEIPVRERSGADLLRVDEFEFEERGR